jgi:hypothetical protein
VNVLRDERGVILSWLLKILILVAVLAVVLFDFGSIGVNYVSLDSKADEVAIAVSITIGSDPPEQFTDNEIFLLARDVVRDPAIGVAGAHVARTGTEIDEEGVVHIRLKRKARTLVAHYVSPFRDWINAWGDGQAGTD